MLRLTPLSAALALFAGGVAHAGPCSLAIESTDMMRFSTSELRVPAGCDEVEVVLHHTGKLPAKVMGHDWVLARTADVSAVVNAGLAAGPDAGYLPRGDARVIAATPVIGGGETATARFRTDALRAGESYSFFCTTPGHSTSMKGRLVLSAAAAGA
jgi:azurin